MADRRIGVVGISTLNAAIGPDGNHLRWTFPRELGFSPKGFRVFRRETKKLSDAPLNFSALPLNVDLPDNLTIENVHFSTHPAGCHLRCRQSTQERTLHVRPSAGGQIDLRFFEPIVHLRFELGGSGYGALRAFSGKNLVAQATSGGSIREIFCQGADRAVIDLGAGQIRSIRFTTQSTACNFNDWQLLKKLALPTSDDEALKLLETGLKNHYALDVNTARVRYKQSASDIVTWLKRLLSPTDEFFSDPDTQPHLLKVRSDVEGPTTATYPQSLFFLAALDPNVARMMCLYWVDAFEPAPQAELPPPNPLSFYDYKIEGDWNDGDERCGLLLNLGQPSAPFPAIRPKVSGKQLDGVRWLNGELHGRIGLTWPRPAFDDMPQAVAVQPVLYDITRVSGGREVRIKEPVLVDNRSWQKSDPVLYIDRDLRLGTYTYKVRAIDLFGQIGPPLQSEQIEIEDKVAPPPPVRTRNFLQPKSERTSLLVQFEFGAAQHEQAPDVKEFQPYWRADTLLPRRNLKVVLAASDDSGEYLVHTLRISNADSSSIPFNEIETFAGDVITNVVSSASETIAVEDRRRFRIARAVAPDKVVLEPTVHPISTGTYELVRDPRNKAVWNRLPQKISWREPITGLLKAIAQDLRAEALTVTRITPPPDPFASVPPEARARNHPEIEPAPDVVEIQIDRVLTEPDAFAGGHARLSGSTNEFDLVYVVTNLAQARTTIALPATATVAAGDTLTLSPAPTMLETVRMISIEGTVDRDRLLTPGGEVAFESSVARVISNAINRSGVFEIVVRAENAQSIGSLRINQSRVRYYAPFTLTVDVAASASVAGPISIPINPAAGRRDGFITFSSIDVRDLEGPLGTASQFTLILPGPSGAPSKPYPCGMDASAEAGYASPPNRAGRSTICLQWDPASLNPTEGLRYEVARALDNGILTAHLRAWQLGKSQPLVAPVIPGVSVSGTLDEIQPSNGLIRARLTITTPVSDTTAFRNGRLVKDEVYYHVTVAKGSGTTIDLLLGGPSELSFGPATIEAPPDYSAVKTDDGALQILALETPDAFALVTGVPVDKNRFVDDVAGHGENRFFYRVRAVDAAENRSPWSPISAPFHQVDTTALEPPESFEVTVEDRGATLSWKRVAHRVGPIYAVYRDEGTDAVFDQTTANPLAFLHESDLSPKRLRPIAGCVTLPQPIEFFVESTMTLEQIATQIANEITVTDLNAGSATTNLYDRISSKPVFDVSPAEGNVLRVRVSGLTGLLPSPKTTALNIALGLEVRDADSSMWCWSDAGLRSAAQYLYRSACVKMVASGTAPPGHPPPHIRVVGPATPPRLVVGLDRSGPPTPHISARWVDASSGLPLTTLAGEAIGEILFAQANGAAEILVQARTPGDATWKIVSSESGKHWRALHGLNSARLILDPAQSHEIRARLKTSDSRLSDFSESFTLESLS